MHWKSEVKDGEVGFDPNLVGGGTTWTMLQVGKKSGEELKDVVPDPRRRPDQGEPERTDAR